MFGAVSFAGETLPTGEEVDASYESDGPLFDAAPVAYDAAQPAEGMESMGMGGMASPAPTRSPTSRRIGPTGSRQANIRLASVPNMFGDFGMSMGRVQSRGDASGQPGFDSQGFFDVPSAGGSRRVKIGENNVALPTDRVYFMYNHFHNVFQFDEQPQFGPRVTSQQHLDRYTFGFEKMFLDDLWSCEVRMPLNSSVDYQGTAFGIDGGNVGNVAIILKNLLYVDESTSVAGGVAFDAPTGSDLNVQVNTLLVEVQNDAFHILPWIGFGTNVDDLFYVTGFAQLDFATVGNDVFAVSENQMIGVYNEQNLLYLDLSVGTWLYRDPTAQRLTSIAIQGELHHTTTIQDSDVVAGSPGQVDFALSNPFNRQDILNGTLALQFEIANTTTFRVAAVTPLSNEIDRRVFDAELQFQLNRRF
jgi:hypothetical protein